MSIYASWPSVGEDDPAAPPRTVLTYMGSHVYPSPDIHPPALVGISHIPGFIWRDGLPAVRRDQGDDDPVAPYLRLDLAEWNEEYGHCMNIGDVILTRVAAERLRDQLSDWLERPMHSE